jgi:hypothetical protein
MKCGIGRGGFVALKPFLPSVFPFMAVPDRFLVRVRCLVDGCLPVVPIELSGRQLLTALNGALRVTSCMQSLVSGQERRLIGAQNRRGK